MKPIVYKTILRVATAAFAVVVCNTLSSPELPYATSLT